MRLIRSFLFAVAVAGMSAAQAGVPNDRPTGFLPADRHKRVDAIFAQWSGNAVPGCAVGISSNGAVDYERGYGMANLEYDVPITPQSIFYAASISKQFTAFSIGLLAQDGKLSLEDDIRKHVPELPDYGKTITIKHLIHHLGGLRDQGHLLNLAGWRGNDVYTEADMLWVLARQGRANFDPGTEVLYGNSAYTLLAVTVRRVSGKSLRAFADERIFKPLGMADTHFRDNRNEIVPRRASAYSARPDGGWLISVPNIDYHGSTGLHTTVGDLLKWKQNLMDARVGGQALIAWMQTSGRLNDGTETGYGGGLDLVNYRGLREVSHEGLDGGFRAKAALFPDQRLAIVALCNGSTIDPLSLVSKVAETYLENRMTTPALAPAVEMPQSEARLSSLAGMYWSPVTDEVVRLEWKDGALRQIGNPTPFVPIGDDVLRPENLPQEWRFIRRAVNAPADASIELRITDFWPKPRVFTRMTAPMPTAATLASLAGRYRSNEADMIYTVRVVDNNLMLSWQRQYDIALDAIGGDRFFSSRGTISFLRDANGAVTGLTISNRRLRRFHAERLSAAAP